MFASATSVVLVGVEPRPVRVEVHVGGGKDVFSLVGLPDAAVREAKERVRAAITSSGFSFPKGRVTVNLSPADVPKGGSAYDLPIALGVLAASGEIPVGSTGVVALGELALDGAVRAVRGGLGAAIVAARIPVACLLPPESAGEALLVADADVRVVSSLSAAVAVATGNDPGESPVTTPPVSSEKPPDIGDVRGQGLARRALEVTAAGGHHLLFTGAPGAGKTMLARCLPGILPSPTNAERLEIAQAWAAAGRPLAFPERAPFRSPHHSATMAALIGGGSGVPVPGELTLAHFGVLFLDELGEFPTHLLDSLRQPIEEGSVVVSRKGASVRFPCAVQVVAATNPCPCGFSGDRLVGCRCSTRAVERYRRRLSGPLLDRFDIRVALGRVTSDELAGPPGEASAVVRSRVMAARKRQTERGMLNRDLGRGDLDTMDWQGDARAMLRAAIGDLALTGRGWDRVRKVARTIADLDESAVIGERHVAEALAYRGAP